MAVLKMGQTKLNESLTWTHHDTNVYAKVLFVVNTEEAKPGGVLDPCLGLWVPLGV